MTGRKNKVQGFTLVELLVVISIIALLLAVLLPSLRRAKAAAEKVVCGKHLQQLGLASMAYFNDYSKFWVTYDIGMSSQQIYKGAITSDELFLQWFNHGLLFSLNYIKTAKIYYCPTSEKNFTKAAGGFTSEKYDTYFVGDKLKSSTGTARASYKCRTYDIVNGQVEKVRVGAIADAGTPTRSASYTIINPLRRTDSKLALLADAFTFVEIGGHLGRFYNTLYADGHVTAYDDKDEWVAASTEPDERYRHSTKRTYADAEAECRSRFGDYLTDNATPFYWLFLDRR